MGPWEIINALGYVLIYPNYVIILLLTKRVIEKVICYCQFVAYSTVFHCHDILSLGGQTQEQETVILAGSSHFYIDYIDRLCNYFSLFLKLKRERFQIPLLLCLLSDL